MTEKLFMMSIRFNKNSPKDFGLVPSNEDDIFIMSTDNSRWKKHNLYDFGWGKENGYYKLPLPNFEQLVDIILSSDCNDNKYGAAAIILEDYCDELLIRAQKLLEDEKNMRNHLQFFKILQLETPINRSCVLGKSHSEVSQDYEKWKDISRQILKYYK